MHTKTRDSLAIDDLAVGSWYEFLPIGKRPYWGIWMGMEGRYGVLDIPAGVLPLFPCGAHVVRDLRWFAACKITAMPEPEQTMPTLHIEVTEPLCECEQRMDASTPQPRWTWPEVVCGVAVFLALSIVLTLLRVWR